MTERIPHAPRKGVSRRNVLLGGAATGVGALAGLGVAAATDENLWRQPAAEPVGNAVVDPSAVENFHGAHQAGIDTPPQTSVSYHAFDLMRSADVDAVQRMMRLLSDDAARLTQGKPALADLEPELAIAPSRLTVTFGFGPALVQRAAGANAVPGWLKPLPPFDIDRIDPAWSDGDLLIQVASDDPLTLAHASRVLLKDTRAFATRRWTQTGFRRQAAPGAMSTRNLFGQVDGTGNPVPGTPDFDHVVWTSTENPGWIAGGSSLVLRRIRMNLDTWDALDRTGREQSVGRRLADGAPLTGNAETDEPDFAALAATGFPVIHDLAHIRRAHSDNPEQRIFRRVYNYNAATNGDAGQLFASFQADIDRQFLPIQQRLSEMDLLNQWTTPIGSAVFAIPPGCAPGGFIGEGLF